MKNLVTALVLAVAIPTMALAGEVSGEYRAGTKSGPTGFDFQAAGSVGKINLGAEVESIQPKHEGAVADLFAVKAGPQLPEVAGFKPVANLQLGRSETTGKDFDFYGVDLGVSHSVFGPVSASVEYRRRQGFKAENLKQDRLSAGLEMAFNKKTALTATYYRDRNDLVATNKDSNVIGVGLKHSF